MTQALGTDWTTAEQQTAQDAFNTAYDRETHALIQEVCSSASQVGKLEDIWQLHDYLSARRHDIDGKYDYDHAMLIFVFAQLLKEGWLSLDDLAGLSSDKLAKITSISRF